MASIDVLHDCQRSLDVDETKEDHEESCGFGVTLVEAIKDKYCSVNEFYDPETLDALRMIKESAPSSKPGAVPVQTLSTLIVESRNIITSGCSEELSSLCPSVKELYIGGNTLSQWDSVLNLLSAMPQLQLLDLKQNYTLSQATLSAGPLSTAHTSLSVLVLSCTSVPFSDVVTVLQLLPTVSELYLSKNQYEDSHFDILNRPQHDALAHLNIVDNNLTEWKSVETLGELFPNLDTLTICSNPLSGVTPVGEKFKNLRNLNLNKTMVSSWECVENLSTYPCLTELSLWHVPIGSDFEDKERRFAMIARLPMIQLLNKSTISETEREDAERWLIRKYKKEPQRPNIYTTLIKKHGNLQPLRDINLSPKKEVSLEFCYDGIERRTEIHKVNIEQTTKQFKTWIGRTLLNIPRSKLRLFYVDVEMAPIYGSVEMKLGTRSLYMYNMKDGDHINIMVYN